jgi:hypothetical protein
LLQDGPEFRRHRERFEGAYIGSARIAFRYQADSSQENGADDAKKLPQALADAAPTPAPHEHPPVNAYMLHGGSLTQHMSSFKVCERFPGLTQRFGFNGRTKLGIDIRADMAAKSIHWFS